MTRDIWKERHLLDKEYREKVSQLMLPYEEYFRNKRQELHKACEEQGHNFKFSHVGPIGHIWSYCSKCGKSKVEDDR